ncbi:MAG: CPXCG motif-containing cysteine-rich protein [Gammaproteobacteria bacterium]|nr:MAG: CPXCG motif-containing cysteine-rich protein [Gammaproteobacteria bacterium]
MNEVESRNIQCPYCGEIIDIVVDCSVAQQNYIEDCQVCCRPINISTNIEQNGDLTLIATHENE